jgi:hypothetical protein
MTPKDSSSDPVISRAALERVLARATELQTASPESPDGISEERLVEIGLEVGIPAEHLRLALAEERTRLPDALVERGPVLNALGSAVVSAQRSITGAPDDILTNIDGWMKREEGLDPNRRSASRLSWSPRNGALSFIYNAVGRNGRKLELVRADEVSVTVTAVDAARSVVRFDADLTRLRRTQRNMMVGLGIGLNAVVFGVIAVPLLILASTTAATGALVAVLAAVGVAQIGAGYGIWRSLKGQYRRTVAKMQVKLEQLLDDLEHGGMVARPSLIGQLRDAMIDAGGPLRGLLPPKDV